MIVGRQDKMSVIELKNVTKEFKIAEKSKNFGEYLFNRKYETIKAVNGIDFTVNRGELVGYIGPNGAGKSTTIKMMTGILNPTEGKIKVLDRDPFKERKKNTYKIGVVFGQRTQLWWEIAAIDTFVLHKKIYNIPDEVYNENMKLFDEVLEIGKYINRSSRQLSLGQRVRLDIALSFLHNPEIVFLDEPTIGLDLVVKKNIRKFIKELSEKRNITLLLTTHDMKDIEAICDRLIMIDKGQKVIDMTVNSVKEKFQVKNIINLSFENKIDDNIMLVNTDVIKVDSQNLNVKYDRNIINPGEIISKLSKHGNICNVDIQEPDIEDIIGDIYCGKIKI